MTPIISRLAGVKPVLKNKTNALTIDGISKRFRQLKRDEVVSLGDFVMNDNHCLEPWEGTSGFQAGAFVKPIYRQDKARSPVVRGLK